MSDQADDLLDELASLEHASDQMQSDVAQAKDKQAQLEETETASEMQAALVSLESSKTAQLAAEQSQKAAEAAIKMSHEQKAQLMEMTDANVAWRQALRNATRDLSSAKSAVSIMTGITVTVSLSAVGAVGWMLYYFNGQFHQMENKVTDILTTEHNLLKKDMTLKVDQLASLIESMAADIKRLNQSLKTPQPAAPEAPVPLDLESEKTLPDENAPNENAPKPTEQASQATMPPKTNTTEAPSVDTPPADAQPALAQSKQPNQPKQPKQNAKQPVPTSSSKGSVASNEKQNALLKQLQTTLQEVRKVQSQLESKTLSELAQIQKTLHNQATPPSDTPKNAASQANPSAGLNPEQAERLKAIAWSAFQERKMLKQLQKTMTQLQKAFSQVQSKATQAQKSSGPSMRPALEKIGQQLNALTENMRQLQTQQSQIEEKVEKLDTLTQKLAAKPEPYQYRAPDQTP